MARDLNSFDRLEFERFVAEVDEEFVEKVRAELLDSLRWIGIDSDDLHFLQEAARAETKRFARLIAGNLLQELTLAGWKLLPPGSNKSKEPNPISG